MFQAFIKMHKQEDVGLLINPYPANTDMVSSYQC